MNRRELIQRAAVAAIPAIVPTSIFASSHKRTANKRILFFTKSSGFEHSVIKQTGDAPGHAMRNLIAMGAEHRFDVTHSKDGTIFSKPETYRDFDAFFFYTTGDLTTPGGDKNPPMTPEGKAAFLKAIHDGKAFIGTHAASDTFHTQPDDPQERSNRYISHGEKADPYVRMLGAEFIKHGPQQVAHMRSVDQKFPGMKLAGDGFDMNEEWYSLKDFQPDLHVLLVQETKDMKGPEYQRAPYPATWARKYGKGRVFFTSMGHREDVWTNPLFVSILTGGIGWALGKSNADIQPNIETACPGYREIPPKS